MLKDEPDYVGIENTGARHAIVDIWISHLCLMIYFEISSQVEGHQAVSFVFNYPLRRKKTSIVDSEDKRGGLGDVLETSSD